MPHYTFLQTNLPYTPCPPDQGHTMDNLLTPSSRHWSPRMGNMRTRLRIKDKLGSCVTTCLTSGARDCRGVAGEGTLLIPPPRICCTRGEGVGGLLAARPPDPLSPPSLRNSCSRPGDKDCLSINKTEAARWN